MKTKYSRLAEPYKPTKIKLLFIAESPPAYDEKETHGRIRYFYSDYLHPRDALFKSFVEALFNIKKARESDKKKLLKRIRNNDLFLIDVCEKPINKLKPAYRRMKELKNSTACLVNRLNLMIKNNRLKKNTPIALISENVYKTVSRKLNEERFNVVNKFIYFPSRWKQHFIKQIKKTIAMENLRIE